jgi:hypothetical protein
MPPRLPLVVILCIAAAVFLTGITWGLPSRDVDRYLFGNHRVWTGQEILDLAGGWDTNSTVAADRDLNPIGKHDQPVLLNGTDAQRAEIVRRYRLFSAQPDEMIQFRALSQIKPGEGKFDPKLYQYGGLWIYPVGALLKLGAVLHLVDVRSDLAFYLDHPEAFARFYIVARLYSVAWGLLGVAAVFAIVRRLTADPVLAALAGLCFAAMPVVITMAHEAKPHLGGAVLMLWAGYAAIRYLDFGTRRWAIYVGLLCGAAIAMVPTSVPIFVLLPILMVLRPKAIGDLLLAGVIGVLVYAVTNPYVILHLFGDRSMLASSAGNTAAMYAVRSPLAGLLNVASLTAEGAGWVIAIGGVIAWLTLHFSATELRHRLVLLALPALAVFAIFAAFGAGKPGEYGRFLIVPDVVLMIGVFVAMRRILSDSARRWQAAAVVLVTAVFGAMYLNGLVRDAAFGGSRTLVAKELYPGDKLIVLAEPAPYCMPAVDLFRTELWLSKAEVRGAGATLYVRDIGTRISWADKPFGVKSTEKGMPSESDLRR